MVVGKALEVGERRRHRPGLPDRIPEEYVMSQGSD